MNNQKFIKLIQLVTTSKAVPWIVVFSNLQAFQGERVLTLENVEEHLRFWLL